MVKRAALVTIALALCFCNGGDDTPALPQTCDHCDGMIKIEPGPYFMGAPDGEGKDREKPFHVVILTEPFWIDKYEVTTGDFAKFLKENGNNCPVDGEDFDCYDCTLGETFDIKIDCAADYAVKSTCEAEPNDEANSSCREHPATLVRWPGARAYCAWKNGHRLPSESEWERAANGPGGADAGQWQRFAWGSDCPGSWGKPDGDLPEGKCGAPEWSEDSAKANCEEIFCHDGFEGTAPVGSFPAGVSPEGVHDMAGNAMEWAEDCFHDNFVGAPDDGSAWLINCKGAAEGTRPKVATGGSFLDDGANMRMALRGGDKLGEGEADPDVGFRCAFSH